MDAVEKKKKTRLETGYRKQTDKILQESQEIQIWKKKMGAVVSQRAK